MEFGISLNCLMVVRGSVVNGPLRPNVSNGNIERYKAKLVTKGFYSKGQCWLQWDLFSYFKKKNYFKINMMMVAHYDLRVTPNGCKNHFFF